VSLAKLGPRPNRPNLLLRSILTSIAFLLLAVPALAAAGGYFPYARAVTGYGRLLITDLPWLVLGAALALVLAVVALRLGGRRFTAALAVATSVVLAALMVVWAQYAALAAAHNATYDVIRQATTPTVVGRGPDQNVVFAEVDGHELHADVWRGTNGSGAGVLYIHGGAFNHGSPGIRPHLFAMLADNGFTVLDIEYRLAPPPRWQDAPADALCALGWFQREAARFDVDPARIVVMGDSAGGNLALIAAYAPGSTGDRITPSCDVAPAPPAGVMAVYPTADLVATWTDARELSEETPFPELYVGGTPTEFADRYAAASANGFIRAGLPPTLVLTGTNDLLVRVERMRDLVVRLRAAGSAADLVEVPFADHAFDGPPDDFGSQLEETVLPAFVRRVAS
jgi:acetyl esterase/lipase